MTTPPLLGYVTDADPTVRERDTHDPEYMAGIEADGEALAGDLVALRARYPGGGGRVEHLGAFDCGWCEDGQHHRCDDAECLCEDESHDDGDTQYADPGEAGGYEGATW